MPTIIHNYQVCARILGGNRYLAGDYLHETISNLEAEDKRGGLRNS
jgi:hypothetical protein